MSITVPLSFFCGPVVMLQAPSKVPSCAPEKEVSFLLSRFLIVDYATLAIGPTLQQGLTYVSQVFLSWSGLYI